MSLQQIQTNLNAPKDQYNSFAKFKYRSAESILEAVKPLLAKHQYSLVISDSLELIGDRYYVKATASLYDDKMSLVSHSSAYAREELTLKGQQSSQITGGTSSYARKYALNGLFLIDDSQDADTQDNTKQEVQKISKVSEAQLKKINTLMTLKKVDRDKIKAHYKVSTLKDLPLSSVQPFIEYLEGL